MMMTAGVDVQNDGIAVSLAVSGLVNGYVANADDLAKRERHMKGMGLMDVTWRSISPYRSHVDHVEMSFETRCGAALRVRMAKDQARPLYEMLGEALYGEPGVQSSSSSETPSSAGLPTDGHVVTPEASS